MPTDERGSYAEVELSYKVPDSATCPYTGEPVRIVHSDNYGWRGVTSFYFTKWLPSRQSLMYHLHLKGGKAPDFPKAPDIRLVYAEDIVAQEDNKRANAEIESEVREQQAAADHMVEEATKK